MRYPGLPLSVTRLKRADLQHLEDKIAGKFVFGTWKNVNMVWRMVLVRVVLTLHAIYPITSIDLLEEVIQKIIALFLHIYGWVAIKLPKASAR
jgi:hypothetical protein